VEWIPPREGRFTKVVVACRRVRAKIALRGTDESFQLRTEECKACFVWERVDISKIVKLGDGEAVVDRALCPLQEWVPIHSGLASPRDGKLGLSGESCVEMDNRDAGMVSWCDDVLS
jgi:hypothetical protein